MTPKIIQYSSVGDKGVRIKVELVGIKDKQASPVPWYSNKVIKITPLLVRRFLVALVVLGRGGFSSSKQTD